MDTEEKMLISEFIAHYRRNYLAKEPGYLHLESRFATTTVERLFNNWKRIEIRWPEPTHTKQKLLN